MLPRGRVRTSIAAASWRPSSRRWTAGPGKGRRPERGEAFPEFPAVEPGGRAQARGVRGGGPVPSAPRRGSLPPRASLPVAPGSSAARGGGRLQRRRLPRRRPRPPAAARRLLLLPGPGRPPRGGPAQRRSPHTFPLQGPRADRREPRRDLDPAGRRRQGRHAAPPVLPALPAGDRLPVQGALRQPDAGCDPGDGGRAGAASLPGGRRSPGALRGELVDGAGQRTRQAVPLRPRGLGGGRGSTWKPWSARPAGRASSS